MQPVHNRVGRTLLTLSMVKVALPHSTKMYLGRYQLFFFSFSFLKPRLYSQRELPR